MKGARSNRVASTEPPDDWVNGSWTVDCICGVTFDDGEEMVNCDECGVWVHTRCSRYVKGDKSFACDKCKSKRRASSAVADAEETEVAQLLVELPTKTMRHSHNNSIKMSSSNNVGSSSGCLWAERPLEERVHVQGVPGGDVDLFSSSGSAFPVLVSSQLWKCSGYIPKKFNFRYTEFPCWENRDDGSENVAVVDKKTAALPPPNSGKQNKNTLLNVSSKRFREELKDGFAKKKVKSFHREHQPQHESKRDRLPAANTVVHATSTTTSVPGFGSKTHKVGSKAKLTTTNNLEKLKQNAAPVDGKLAVGSFEDSALTTSADKSALDHTSQLHKSTRSTLKSLSSPDKDGVTVGTFIKKEVIDGGLGIGWKGLSMTNAKLEWAEACEVAGGGVSRCSAVVSGCYSGATDVDHIIISSKISTSAVSSSCLGLVVSVDEIQAPDSESPALTSDLPKSKSIIDELTNADSERKNTEIVGKLEAIILPGTDQCSNERKSDVPGDNPKDVLASHHDGINIKSGSNNLCEHVLSLVKECKGSNLSEVVGNTSKPSEQDGKDSDNNLEAVADYQFGRDDEVTDFRCSAKLECGASESSMNMQKLLSDSKEAARAGQTPQTGGAAPSPRNHHKISLFGKSSSTSPAIVFSRSYTSDKSKSGGSQNHSLVGNGLMPKSCVNTKKDTTKGDDKHDKPVSTLKDNSKSCFNSTLKSSQPSRTALKHHASVGKDLLRHSSSKVSSVDNSSASSSGNEPAGALQSEHALSSQNKFNSSVGQQRGEKVPQSNVQQLPKSNQPTGHPLATSNSPAGLSDEELALLLHQELNSSPRVPRVPRVRNAGSLPQLPSASAANMLMKRTSIAGGKDKNMFSRRKSRDAPKDEARSSREQDSEVGKVDRVPSSPDSSKQSDAFNQAEVNADSKAKKARISSSAASSGTFTTDPAELKSSSGNSHEDEARAHKNSDRTYRTLPGLIAEIMGAGKRMAYEELCDAVLPHWPHLRKHNGERYAYSTHSQAVLDCLRNRAEWARLVDRGPKTSSSRRKRKIDAELLSSESEDVEDRNHKDSESKSFESNKEEFPKGRRNVRKRRGLAPQGRSVQDGQKKRKVEVGSSCDSGSFSNSSEDSVSSQDDSQGSEMDVANTEVSASSQEMGAMS
ncbi:hypothetical protein KSS87_001593 [Heliosperma pusillum]|nr:hypothetical protein KSS87_001593 [Heliosperma pusillum]